MARRRSVSSNVAQIRKDQERQRRERERARLAAIKANEKAARDAERATKAEERRVAEAYAAARTDEAEREQRSLDRRIEELDSILFEALKRRDSFDPLKNKREWRPLAFEPGQLARPLPRPEEAHYEVPSMSSWARLVPGSAARHQAELEQSRLLYEEQLRSWEMGEKARLQELEAARNGFERRFAQGQAEVARQNREIELFADRVRSAEPEAVVRHFELALSTSAWPRVFEQSYQVVYDPTSRLLGVDLNLPTMERVVPRAKSVRYVKASDEIRHTNEAESKRRTRYKSVVAQSCLRILHEVFSADHYRVVETVALNAYVSTVDPSTGQPIRPCVVSLRTTRERFEDLNLQLVEPTKCLQGLSAALSQRPDELEPVKPIVELKLIDARFVEEEDVISELDQRPNLMDLSPNEFESLITNLFLKMGLESRQTKPSRDGGVDCVAYDPRPIFGGKVVIQAKRYKNTVGVAAVRDLYGTLQNEGASKGILVTTSGYGKASYDFAEGKPIELLTGPNLLYLLEEHTGTIAKIVSPDDWVDPVGDEPDPNERQTQVPDSPSGPGTSPQHYPFPQPRSGRPDRDEQ